MSRPLLCVFLLKTNLMTKSIAFIFICLSLFACKDIAKELETDTNNRGSREFIPDHDANPVMTTARTIAIKNGLDKWDQVNKIEFTFNVDRGESHFERSWIWEPKTTAVTMIMGKDTVSYKRNAMDSTHLRADQSFINDKYWLLAPYNLVWDEGTRFSEKESVVAPISKDTMNMLTIKYGNEGGYTPGDAYDFYFGKDFVIKEWVFRENDTTAPSMITTWEDYQVMKGLNIARMHKDSTGNLKLYFSNISVK